MQDAVVIVGAGWAGIAAGVELARHGVAVQVLESARRAGGRARTVEIGTFTVDNGQHLLIGAYQATLALLRILDIPESAVLYRQRLNLDVRSPHATRVRLRAPILPAPLHLLTALLGARGIGWRDKLAALRTLPDLMRWQSDEDLCVSELLSRHRQPTLLTEALWAPLCIAALNVPPEHASAAVFTRVLRDSFATCRAASDLLIPRKHLGSVLPEPGAAYIARQGGRVDYGQRCTAITAQAERLAIRTPTGVTEASDVIVATTSRAAARLLTAFPETTRQLSALNALGDEPIVTVYLQYPNHTRLEVPMIGLRDTMSQWVFDRSVAGQPGLLAVVISADGKHMQWDNATLTAAVGDELASVFPGLRTPETALVVREKRATFRCVAGSSIYRPGHATAHPGLWLAGDYTDTGLPATLEGAVRSGLECAHAILKRRNIEIKAC